MHSSGIVALRIFLLETSLRWDRQTMMPSSEHFEWGKGKADEAGGISSAFSNEIFVSVLFASVGRKTSLPDCI
jgi:hypothetical protein